MAQSKKRGRPKRDASAAGDKSGPVFELRSKLNEIVGVCVACHRPINPIQPIAEQAQVTPITLAKFMRGEAGLSLETFTRLWTYVQNYTPEEASEAASA